MSDAGYFLGLRALMNSVYIYYGRSIPVVVMDVGLTKDQVDEITKHPTFGGIIPCKLCETREQAWQIKQSCFVFSSEIARIVCWIDSDSVLTDRIDEAFEAAEQGYVVVPRWVEKDEALLIDPSGATTGEIVFSEKWAQYGKSLVGKKIDWFVSSIVCLDVSASWDLVAAWAFTSKFALYARADSPLPFVGLGDEAHLVGCVAALGKEVLYLSGAEWADAHFNGPFFINKKTSDGKLFVQGRRGKQQKVLHDIAGFKWWQRPMNECFRPPVGQKWEIFEHFLNFSTTGR
jgi:hypothetical protein